MDFKYLVIYSNKNPKVNAYGWAIFETFEEVQSLIEYYKAMGSINLYVHEKLTIKYDNFTAMEEDVEMLPISEAYANGLKNMFDVFDDDAFGVFPL